MAFMSKSYGREIVQIMGVSLSRFGRSLVFEEGIKKAVMKDTKGVYAQQGWRPTDENSKSVWRL
jgi:hypothetical protein